MKDSVLHLEGYYIRELSVVLNESFADKMPFGTCTGYHYHPEKSSKIEPSQFQVKSEIGQRIDDASRWRYELLIQSSGRKDKAPYSFKISLVGYFHVHSEKKADDERLILFVNAPSVLFSAAREALAAATARGPYPAVVLPLVSFADDVEEMVAEAAKRIPSQALKQLPAKKKGKTRRVRRPTKKSPRS